MGAPTRCNRRYSIPAVLLAVLLLSCHRSLGAFGLEGAAGNGGEKHFIHISGDGKSFALDGKDFFVHGFNQPQMMTHAVENKKHILEVLGDAELHGFNLMRTWAFNDGFDQWQALQPLPGIFDEQVFRALDYVLMQSRKHKIRVLLSITNQWDDYGGANQYVKWANLSAEEAHGGQPFYSNLKCREMYKDFARALVNRRNIYTGIRYRDDEYIFGWDLINEPRVESGAGASQLQFWTWEMAAYLKRLDPNHLVTSGSEGFFGPSTPSLLKFNPGEWTASHGVDFVQNHNLSTIDFGVFHLYPDNWFEGDACDSECRETFTRDYIHAHLNTGLRKPILLEEVGKKGEDRDAFLLNVYEMMHRNHIEGGYGAGTVVWQLSPSNFSDVDSFSIYLPEHQSTGNVIKSFGVKVATRMASAVSTGKRIVGWAWDIVRSRWRRFMGNRFWNKHVFQAPPPVTAQSEPAGAVSANRPPLERNATNDSSLSEPAIETELLMP